MNLAIRDTVLTFMPHWLGITIRCLNIVLAAWTAVFSVVSAIRAKSTQAARFWGLALLTATFAWGTLFKLESPFTIQIPFYCAALILSTYGTLGYLRTPG